MNIDILIADADDMLRDVYRDYFARKGFTIETVADKWDCVEQIIAHRPFFLIVDVGLFEDGSEKAVLSDAEAFRQIPVVIATGDDQPARLAEQTGVPVTNCFCKPYSFVTLLKCMCAGAARANVPPRHSMEGLANLIGSVAVANEENANRA